MGKGATINDAHDTEQYDDLRRSLELHDLDLSTYEPVEFVIDKILERGAISLLFGKQAAGKSTIAISEIVSIAAGKDLLNLDADIKPGRVAVYWSDEGLNIFQNKVNAVCKYYQLDAEQVAANIKHMGQFDAVITPDNAPQVAAMLSTNLQGFAALYVDSISNIFAGYGSGEQ